MTDGRLRVAILGADHIHRPDHVAAVAATPGAELVDDVSRADAVIVGAATARRPDLVRAAVATGVPTLIEKPVAPTVAGVREIAELIDETSTLVTTAMFLRCSPALRRVRDLLAVNVLGVLSSCDLEFTHPGLSDGWFAGPTSWMLSVEHAGGAFADLGIHLLDLLLWLRPGASLVPMAARLDHDPSLPVDVGGTALLDWDGVTATIRTGWRSRPGGFALRLTGSSGSCTVDGGDLTVHIGHTRTEHHHPPAAGDAVVAFLAQVRCHHAWTPPTSNDIVTCATVLDDLARGCHRGRK